MTDDDAWEALREAFAGNDAGSAAWSQTAPDLKARCVAYVASATSRADGASRAREIAQLASAGPIQEAGTGMPRVPEHLPYGFGGMQYPAGR